MALHNCKQGQEWINYNNIYKTSLLNISKICMDISVASSLHGNKITADKDLKKSQVPEIRNIIGPSLHACASHHIDHKKCMASTYVNMAWRSSKHMQSSCPYAAHNNCSKNDKSSYNDKNQHQTIYSTLASMIWESRWTEMNMAQWNKMKRISRRTFRYIMHAKRSHVHGDMMQRTWKHNAIHLGT